MLREKEKEKRAVVTAMTVSANKEKTRWERDEVRTMLLRELLDYDNIVVQCHDNPDADAIASGYALYRYLQEHGKKARIIYGGHNIVRKSNLKLMAESLEIPIEHVEKIDGAELLVTVDCQYGAGNVTHFPAQHVAVIDHHRVEVDLPALAEVRSSLGSCSTVIWQMLKDEEYDINKDTELATALYYGLMTDTNGFAEISHPLDKDLRDTARFSKDLITRYRNANISLEELEIAGAALMQHEYNEDYRFAVVKAAPCDPNVLGIISDLLLEVDAVDICLVFCLSGAGVKLSVRSCVKEVKANELADEICRGVGSGGGHFVKAGGYIRLGLLNKAYLEYCERKGIHPRMELSPDGKAENLSGSAMKSFLVTRMKDYFENSEIIYAREYDVDMDGMETYRGKPIMLGYVRGGDLFPLGTAVTIRTFQEDIDTVIEEDTVFTIGIKGEVYLEKETSFLEKHHIYKQPYELTKAEYQPTIRATETGEIVVPLKYAKICIPYEQKRVRARQLDHTVKVFTLWDESRYVLGRPGDYLLVHGDNPHDITVMEEEIFNETYQHTEDKELQEEIRAVVFDLDGTLLDTLEDLTDAVNIALRRNHMPTRTLAEVRSFLGNGMQVLIEKAVIDGRENPFYQKTYEEFRDYYDKHCQEKTDIYPGVRLLLDELRYRGIQMAIVSNKADPDVKKLSDKYFSDYIHTAIGETPDIARKPAPDTVLEALAELKIPAGQAVYVGDSEVDIHTADNAGLQCISVTWGFRDRNSLVESGARHLIDRPIDLLSYIK